MKCFSLEKITLPLTGNPMLNQSAINERAKQWAEKVIHKVDALTLVAPFGRVHQVLGTLIEAKIPEARIGDLCEIRVLNDGVEDVILSEVIGFTDTVALLSALDPPEGITFGTDVVPLGCKHKIEVTDAIYGGVYDGMGRALGDTATSIFCKHKVSASDTIKPVVAEAVSATEKPRISDPLETGIKSIDTLLTIGEGQRLGLFAGAGCGKTTLLASLARGAKADVVIFALIGERGRELKEFIDHEMDEDLRSRSIIICATSDRSSMERSRAGFTATAIAEAFRDQGKKVLLLVDSLTRFARAQREIGLAAGEPPAKGGFPPSVYTMLPRLIERAGKTYKGSITAIYTILMEGDSITSDPIADEAKSLLDGHIVLSRKLAEKGHYPAIDILMSLSRTMVNVVSEEQTMVARRTRGLLANYKELELLIRLGEYQSGNDDESDEAVERSPKIMQYLQQSTREIVPLKDAVEQLKELIV